MDRGLRDERAEGHAVRVRKMAFNRGHVAGLLIKTSLALHFVDISVCTFLLQLDNNNRNQKQKKTKAATAKRTTTKANRNQKKSGASLISRSTTVEPQTARHTHTHTWAAEKCEMVKGKLNNNKMDFVACACSWVWANSHCYRQHFCNLSLHKYTKHAHTHTAKHTRLDKHSCSCCCYCCWFVCSFAMNFRAEGDPQELFNLTTGLEFNSVRIWGGKSRHERVEKSRRKGKQGQYNRLAIWIYINVGMSIAVTFL